MQLNHLSDWARVIRGTLQGADLPTTRLSIDTRTLNPGEIYLAIRGERFDGHAFIAQAEQAGASALIVEGPVDSHLPQIRVRDGRLALGHLALAWRSLWGGPVVGITGSNGKTTIKELVAVLLAESAPVWKTRGNLNNDIGVPLTLLELRPQQRYAVVEMGANHHGEIDYVARLARPDVAIISNAGPAHLEGFGSVEGVSRAKGELLDALPPDGVAVLNADDPYYEYWRERAGSRKVASFGFAPQALVRADPESFTTGYHDGCFHTRFEACVAGQILHPEIPLLGRHSVRNTLAALAAAGSLGLDCANLLPGLQKIERVSGRFQPVRGKRNVLLIDDTYNANPGSVEVAFEVLADWPGEAWVALGTLGELGDASDALHAAIGHRARACGVTRLLATGTHTEQTVAAFGSGAIYCTNQTEMIDYLLNEPVAPALLLVKGSRSQQMEQVINALREHAEPCC